MTRKKYGLLLMPGAGADSSSPALIAVEKAVPKNFVVQRADFPYRLAGRKAPDRQPVLLESVANHLNEFAQQSRLPLDRIFIGGRSMGGRMCSIAAADGLKTAGLVLMSYPLHPPGKPDKLRVDHFPQIEVPTLFVSGTRDAFGAPAEIKKHVKAITTDVSCELIEGGDHGMAKYSDRVAEIVAQWLVDQTRAAA